MRKAFSFIFVAVLCLLLQSALNAQPVWDWHISGGTVVDGTGNNPYKSDILIAADTIAYIGPVDSDTIRVRNTVDATGKIITPGFIDVHAHGNPLETPEFRNFLAMGVTTILLGQDGSSPTKDSMEDWFAKVQQASPAVNVAALSGHGSIRNKTGVGNRPANDQEINRMKRLLEADLRVGSFGMSTGLEYVPGMYADQAELQHLAEIVGRHKGIVMSHMRSEDDSDILKSIDELASLGDHSKVHISHLKVVYGKGADRAKEILAYIDILREKRIEISADTYPYAASYTGIGIVFPDWAKTEAQWRQAMKERSDVLGQYLHDKVKQRNGPDAILFGSGKYAGKTLKKIVEEEGKSYTDVLMEMGPQAASAAHFVMDEELQDQIAIDPDVMISSDGSPTMRHPRGYGSFARAIRRYVIEQESLTIEKAVHKMSGLPAQTLGLTNRGIIKKGNKADLLIFDSYQVQDKATFAYPHQLAEGIEWVWINGKPARQASTFSGSRFGKVLKNNKSF